MSSYQTLEEGSIFYYRKLKAKQTFAISSIYLITFVGRDNLVGIATRYRLDSPGIESRWGEIFRTRPDRRLYNGFRGIPGGLNRLGRGADPPTHLTPMLKKV